MCQAPSKPNVSIIRTKQDTSATATKLEKDGKGQTIFESRDIWRHKTRLEDQRSQVTKAATYKYEQNTKICDMTKMKN